MLRFTGLLRSIALVTAFAAIDATTADAATLTDSSGLWTNAIGGGSTVQYQTSGSENQIRWGNPLFLGGQKSGLGFSGVGTSSFDLNTQFLVGTLRHFNNAVLIPSTSAVDLLLNLNFADIGGTALSRQFTFNFGITETPNQPPCAFPSTAPCADRISFLNTFASETLNISGQDYTLKLLGFSNSPTPGSPLSDFISQEGGTSTAYLYGEIAAAPRTAVPEPGSIAGIAAIGLYLGARRIRLRGK